MARRINRTNLSRAARALAEQEGIPYQQALARLRGQDPAPGSAPVPASVWVLLIEHRHGSDTYVHTSAELAWETLSTYLDAWWSTDGPRDEHGTVLDRPEDITAAVEEYFFEREDEFYTLTEQPLIGAVPVPGPAAAVASPGTARNAGIPPQPSSLVVHVQPQAWIDDHAVDVDAEGTQTWAVTGATRDAVQEALGRGWDLDLIAADPLVPDWVRDWSGPFRATVVCSRCGRRADEGIAVVNGTAVCTDHDEDD